MDEYRRRSIAKAISWRVIATFTTMSIVFIFTRELVLSLEVGFFEVTSKMLFYYFHERIWASISWGKLKHPLSSLPITKEITPEDMDIIRRRLKELGYL
ncbi:MAG: DUF2061 domain-containing protein [Candidatus Glassbacteria bacterium]